MTTEVDADLDMKPEPLRPRATDDYKSDNVRLVVFPRTHAEGPRQ